MHDLFITGDLKRRLGNEGCQVIWVKTVLASFCAFVLLSASGVTAFASEVSRSAISIRNEKTDGGDYAKQPPSNSGPQATTKQHKPDLSVDQGAFWTPDDVGPAYDMSGIHEDDLHP